MCPAPASAPATCCGILTLPPFPGHLAVCCGSRFWQHKGDVFHLLLGMAIVLDDRWAFLCSFSKAEPFEPWLPGQAFLAAALGKQSLKHVGRRLRAAGCRACEPWGGVASHTSLLGWRHICRQTLGKAAMPPACRVPPRQPHPAVMGAPPLLLRLSVQGVAKGGRAGCAAVHLAGASRHWWAFSTFWWLLVSNWLR